MMIVKKGALLGIIITLLTIALIVSYFFIFAKRGLEKAIDEFEGRDYQEAIQLLNRIAKTADTEKGETIYYYRCKAINGLAAQLEEKLSDELSASALEKKDHGEFKER